MAILLLCALLSALALGTFVWLAYQNVGSDKILKPAIQITAALIAAIAFFSLDLLSSDDKASSEINYLAIYHKNGGPFPFDSIISSIDSDNGQGFNDLCWVSRMHKVKTDDQGAPIDSLSQIAIQDLEMSLRKWIAKRQSSHWDTTHYWFRGISGGSGTTSTNPTADSKTTVIDLGSGSSEISDRFSSDTLNCHFPDGTTFTCKRSGHSFELRFASSHYLLTISCSITGGGQIGPSRLGQRLAMRIHDTNDWQTVRGQINTTATFKRSRKWSKHTENIKTWVDTICNDIERDFSWDTMKPDLEDALTTMRSQQKYVTPDSITNPQHQSP